MQFVQNQQCNWLIASDDNISDGISWTESSLASSESIDEDEQESPDFRKTSPVKRSINLTDTPGDTEADLATIMKQFKDPFKFHTVSLQPECEFRPFRAYQESEKIRRD